MYHRFDTAAVLALRFLRVEKRKHIGTTCLTSCWHSSPRVTIFINEKAKIGTCNRPDKDAIPTMRFLQSKKQKMYVQTACPAADIAALVLRFLRRKKRKQCWDTLAKPWVDVALHILVG